MDSQERAWSQDRSWENQDPCSPSVRQWDVNTLVEGTQWQRWPPARPVVAPAKALCGCRNNAQLQAQWSAAASAEPSNLTVMKSLRGRKWKQRARHSADSAPHAHPGLPCHFGTTGCWQPACCPRWCTSEWLRPPPWRAWWILWSPVAPALLRGAKVKIERTRGGEEMSNSPAGELLLTSASNCDCVYSRWLLLANDGILQFSLAWRDE